MSNFLPNIALIAFVIPVFAVGMGWLFDWFRNSDDTFEEDDDG